MVLILFLASVQGAGGGAIKDSDKQYSDSCPVPVNELIVVIRGVFVSLDGSTTLATGGNDANFSMRETDSNPDRALGCLVSHCMAACLSFSPVQHGPSKIKLYWPYGACIRRSLSMALHTCPLVMSAGRSHISLLTDVVRGCAVHFAVPACLSRRTCSLFFCLFYPYLKRSPARIDDTLSLLVLYMLYMLQDPGLIASCFVLPFLQCRLSGLTMSQERCTAT